jgi:hypothetical protein
MSRSGQGLGGTGGEEQDGGNEERKAFEFHGVTFSNNEWKCLQVSGK